MNNMLEYNGYHALIEYDSEDEIFWGKVFGISDSLAFHGSSVSELKEMFAQSIDNYLEHCKEIGKEPDKEFKGTFNVRISPSMHRDLALKAIKNKHSLNKEVEIAISAHLKGSQAEKTPPMIVIQSFNKDSWETDYFGIMPFSYVPSFLNGDICNKSTFTNNTVSIAMGGM